MGAACLLMLQRALLGGVAVVVPVRGCWKGFCFSIWKRCYLGSMLVYTVFFFQIVTCLTSD